MYKRCGMKEMWSLSHFSALLLQMTFARMVKNPPAMRDTWVRSLGWEDALEEDMATYPSILTWRIPCTEEPGYIRSMGSQRVRHSWLIFSSLQFTSLLQQITLGETGRTPSEAKGRFVFRHERLEFSGQACLEGESSEVRVLKLCFKVIVCAASIETPPSAPMMEGPWGGRAGVPDAELPAIFSQWARGVLAPLNNDAW